MVAQNSFQLLDFHGSFITNLYHLMLQSWYQKTATIIGEHVVIIDAVGYHSNSMTLLKTLLITALRAYNSKTAR